MKTKVFEYFCKVTAIPRGSGNTEKIADFLVEFAKTNSLKYIRDEADNVIIFKDGMLGGENKEPVILQGHTDMVCQQTADSKHDFSVSGPEIIKDGDEYYITTCGWNGYEDFPNKGAVSIAPLKWKDAR